MSQILPTFMHIILAQEGDLVAAMRWCGVMAEAEMGVEKGMSCNLLRVNFISFFVLGIN